MSDYCLDHIWYNFKLYNLLNFIEGNEYNWYRICEKCFSKEFESRQVDNFKQIRCIWSSLDYMRVNDKLNDKFLEVERDIKIKNILK